MTERQVDDEGQTFEKRKIKEGRWLQNGGEGGGRMVGHWGRDKIIDRQVRIYSSSGKLLILARMVRTVASKVGR